MQISYQFIITLFHTCFVSFDGIISDKLSFNTLHIMTLKDSSNFFQMSKKVNLHLFAPTESTLSLFCRFNRNPLAHKELQILRIIL